MPEPPMPRGDCAGDSGDPHACGCQSRGGASTSAAPAMTSRSAVRQAAVYRALTLIPEFAKRCVSCLLAWAFGSSLRLRTPQRRSEKRRRCFSVGRFALICLPPTRLRRNNQVTDSAALPDGRVIENPINGECIVICTTGAETGGQLLALISSCPLAVTCSPVTSTLSQNSDSPWCQAGFAFGYAAVRERPIPAMRWLWPLASPIGSATRGPRSHMHRLRCDQRSARRRCSRRPNR